jgi:AGCS family alanine or glycine:cation symporter
MVEKADPRNQAIMAMIGNWSVMFICLLSGLVVLLTDSWLDPSVGVGVRMLNRAFSSYTNGYVSDIVVIISTFLFPIGSIIGNSYNGGQGFLYLTRGRFLNYYYFAMAGFLFLGSIFSVKVVWSFMDFFLVPVVLINSFSVMYLLFKRSKNLEIDW